MKKFILLAFLLITSISFSQSGKFNGVFFGDMFYKTTGDSINNSNQYSMYKDKTTGFTVRRTRLHYEHTFNENFVGNFGMESNDITKLDGKVSFVLYDANFEWKNVVPYSGIVFGLMPTPTFVGGFSERLWGYRSIEKTIADKNGLGTAVDIGVAMKGNFNKTGTLGYYFMIGNGKGLKPEVSKFIKFYGELFAKPFDNFVFEIYGDYQNGANEAYIYTLMSEIGYKSNHNSLTFEPIFQKRNNYYGMNTTANPFGFSIKGKMNLSHKTDAEQTEKINIFARYDFFNPDSNTGIVGYNEHFITAGIDIIPFKNFHIMPNVWMNMYKNKNNNLPEKDNDIVARMTFWFMY